MKNFGWLVLIVGIISAISALNMDTSVATEFGGRVNNLGLMADRQNYILIGGFITLAGLLMVIFDSRKQAKESYENSGSYVPCPYCAEPIRAEAIKCKHCQSNVEPSVVEKLSIFSISDISDDTFYTEANGSYQLNESAVRTLANELKKSNSGMHLIQLEKKYQIQINELKNRLPENIRGEFMRVYSAAL